MRSGHEMTRERLPEYLRGALNEDAAAEVEAHLRGCPDCTEELDLLKQLCSLEVPDPGELYWKTLPQRVKGAVREERPAGLPWLFRRLPLAAAVAALVLLLFISLNREADLLPDPFFTDPFSADLLEYDGIDERDIAVITEELPYEALLPGDLIEYSYYREFASLSPEELESLYEALEAYSARQQDNTG